MGWSVPTLNLFREMAAAAAPAYDKFRPVDLSTHFRTSPKDFGPRSKANGLIRMPTGKQQLRGIPFWLGPDGTDGKSWLVLSTRPQPWATRRIEIPIDQRASHLCLAQFCDWDQNEDHPAGPDVIERVGQKLADAVLVYAGGTELAFPLRRRFEVNSPSGPWGHLSFAALPHRAPLATKLSDPLPQGTDWGSLQDGVRSLDSGYPILWLCSLANPEPERTIRALRLEAAAEDPLVICGLTLFQGKANPLYWERLSLYRITLPQVGPEDRWEASVDLGVVARQYARGEFRPESWLAAPDAGLGEQTAGAESAQHLYVEVTASPEATVLLRDKQTGTSYRFDLGKAMHGEAVEGRPVGPRIQILEQGKVWVHGRVRDSVTKGLTPVRLAFRSKDGRYLPPYGHRTEINDAWFQDYGADVKLQDSSFAYVDGTFQVELPVGEVYAEMTKGFEYAPVRRRLQIEPGQRELELEITRLADFRAQGWITADTHVHFLSPSTGILEGQAEGLNLINLLASQWGDLFTNVGDLFQGPVRSQDGETMVWVGTENRQHLLGHIGLLGGHGEPVYPMTAAGPSESYIGDPVWSSLAAWADACRKREGLAVAVHFPYPTAELAADIVLGKIDAVELYPRDGIFDNLRYNEWYRYLNCGYPLPAVGGTDKMGAYMPVGANRTYAWIGGEEFSFANWAKAVRQGNTFVTTGPLLLFQADGRRPGEEIVVGAGGGAIEVRVEAKSFVPIHRVEVIFNGKVLASHEENAGARQVVLKEKVKVPGPGWLAARCSSRYGPTTSWRMGVAAHTSPVYLRAPGRDLFSPPAAAYFLTLIEGTETWMKTLAVRPDAERFASVLQVLADAREHLHRRLHEHGGRAG